MISSWLTITLNVIICGLILFRNSKTNKGESIEASLTREDLVDIIIFLLIIVNQLPRLV